MKSRYTDGEPRRIWGERGKESDGLDGLVDGDGLAMANESVDSHPPDHTRPSRQRARCSILINMISSDTTLARGLTETAPDNVPTFPP
jgi:hypothetical protein